MATLEAKTNIGSNESYLQMKNPKLITEIIQSLTEREAAPDRAM